MESTKKLQHWTVALMCCACLSACSERSSQDDAELDPVVGKIRELVIDLYADDAESGEPFASGSVSLVHTPEGEPGIGFWSIAARSPSPDVSLGSGELRWHTQADGLRVELHPGMVDHNIEMLIADEHGTWQYLTDAGITESGTLRVTSDVFKD